MDGLIAAAMSTCPELLRASVLLCIIVVYWMDALYLFTCILLSFVVSYVPMLDDHHRWTPLVLACP